MISNKPVSTDIFNDILTNEEHTNLQQMVKDFTKDKDLELEVSFPGLSYVDFVRISEHYVGSTPEKNISAQTSLDAIIILENGQSYRTSILTQDKMDQFISKFSRTSPNSILRFLSSLDPTDDYDIIMKDRGSSSKMYVPDISANFKLTTEYPIDTNTKPKIVGNEKMLFRYKNRYTFQTSPNVQIDITEVQESNALSGLMSRPSKYEIEMEVINRKINIDTFLTELLSVLKIVQNTDFPIGKEEIQSVLKKYQSLLGTKYLGQIEARNVISMSKEYIVKYIPNRYSVTDKADGERFFMFSIEQGVYLISLGATTVRKQNFIINDEKYQDMILDGELINNENGKMYLIFDVVYALDTDFRSGDKNSLTKRIEIVNKIVDKCFQTLIPFIDYTSKHNDMDLAKIRAYYTIELEKYWKAFRKELSKNKNSMFITRKVYMVPYGIDPSEVFMYGDLLWKLSVYDKITPYKLDGTVWTPNATPYMIRVSNDDLDNFPLEYKWKPPIQNSIDFYITFEKNTNGTDVVYYDKTYSQGEGKAYKICTLHVGITKVGKEIPVPFKINGVEQTANIYLVDDEARDTDGNVISDKTVIEFIFDTTKTDIDNSYKWIPIKIRYDKTESVHKYGKKYGNNLKIASRIWKTIINPITEEMIASLGNPLTYAREMDVLTKYNKPDVQQTSIYYQKKTGNAAGMRAFNNWIKSNLILTYCLPGDTVLDAGCGRGGDLTKFVHAGVSEYVGFDIDNNGLYIINDSANNRYKNLKKHNKNIPPMYFINADARGLLNVESQQNIIPKMSSFNKELMETLLSGNKKYNVINCQFTLHYYLSDEISWKNFCQNINDHIEDNGYLLITCFDGKLIYDKLKTKSKMNVSYTNESGQKSTFFEILKIYNDSEAKTTGMAIDLYNSLISDPGVYNREYLVFPEFLESSLKENCDLELVESDSFFSLFNLYKNYFLKDESEVKTVDNVSQKRFSEIKQFYLDLVPNNHSVVAADVALASFKFAMLNKYYVFRKRTPNINIDQPSRIVGVNQKINLGNLLMPYFHTNNMKIDPDKKTTNINKLYKAVVKRYPNIKPSVYLVRHQLITDELDDIYAKRNKLNFVKIKDGTDPKTLLIYKSPESNYYPIYYQNIHYNDDQYVQNRLPIERIKKTFLLDSTKIVSDLDILVKLFNK